MFNAYINDWFFPRYPRSLTKDLPVDMMNRDESHARRRKGVKMTASGVVKKLIEEAAVGRGASTYLGMGEVYFVPSSELGAYYLVVKIERKGWACECRGFRFSSREDGCCSHVDDAMNMRKERLKLAKRSSMSDGRVRKADNRKGRNSSKGKRKSRTRRTP